MFRQRWQASAILLFLPAIAVANTGLIQVTGIRSFSHPDSTRVIVETTGKFEFRVQREYNPDRLFFDVSHARPWIARRRYATRVINDALVRRVRIAETATGATRIAFDLTEPAYYRVSRLEAPDRMVIEVRPMRANSLRRPFVYPPVYRARTRYPIFASNPPQLTPAPLEVIYFPEPVLQITLARPPRNRAVQPPRPVPYDAAPHPSENASRSLTRALGLKINRIVIDAGHGGRDQGTVGPNGVLEKDIVLDVALRVAKLIEAHMGAEVILTRSEDTYIPLQARTAIANEHKADLFLSIHANSSPAVSVAGTETYYLNFTNSATALDVASRENAGSEKSVGELRDLIQSITLNDKIAESQTFAQTIQSSIFAQAAKSNVVAKNRGVKRAPFVVLIGASMPSVLAEIGFLSNSKDEANLGKADYRQKIAEALYKGISQYSQSLSHFEVAGQLDKTPKPSPVGLN